jgi:hypothetical protein
MQNWSTAHDSHHVSIQRQPLDLVGVMSQEHRQVMIEQWTIGSPNMRDVIYIYIAFELTH